MTTAVDHNPSPLDTSSFVTNHRPDKIMNSKTHGLIESTTLSYVCPLHLQYLSIKYMSVCKLWFKIRDRPTSCYIYPQVLISVKSDIHCLL